MDWSGLFLSAGGRIGQKDYWIGVLILFVVWVAAGLAHIFAPLVWLVLLYPWVCVVAKRLHDFAKSGWLILIPILIGFVALCLALIVGGAAAVGALISAFSDAQLDANAWMTVAGVLGVAFAFLAVAGLAKIIFLVWVGLKDGDAGPNRYGPAPDAAQIPPPAAT
jgi:uncharacterized membrane protein YhaH (DUF805 family)